MGFICLIQMDLTKTSDNYSGGGKNLLSQILMFCKVFSNQSKNTLLSFNLPVNAQKQKWQRLYSLGIFLDSYKMT